MFIKLKENASETNMRPDVLRWRVVYAIQPAVGETGLPIPVAIRPRIILPPGVVTEVPLALHYQEETRKHSLDIILQQYL